MKSSRPHQRKLSLALSPRDRFAIVASSWQNEIVERLIGGAEKVLREHGIGEKQISLYRVPGSFEIPGTVAKLIEDGRFCAIVTLGCLIRGETPHFDLLANAVTRELSSLSTETDIPVSFGVLTCDTRTQAKARAGGRVGNKGEEAAQAALELLAIYRQIDKG